MARSKQYSSDYIPAAYVPVGSNAAELRAMADANEAFGTAISGIGTKIKTGVKDWSGIESAKVESYLEQFPDDISRRNALAELMDYEKQAETGGSQIGRFTNLEDVNEAVKEMQLRDFKEAERAEQADAAIRLEDAFQYEKGRRTLLEDRAKQTFESDLAYSQAQTADIADDNAFQQLQHRLEQEKHQFTRTQEIAKQKFTEEKFKTEQKLAEKKFTSDELEKLIDNARADEKMVSERDAREDEYDLSKRKFEEQKLTNEKTRKANQSRIDLNKITIDENTLKLKIRAAHGAQLKAVEAARVKANGNLAKTLAAYEGPFLANQESGFENDKLRKQYGNILTRAKIPMPEDMLAQAGVNIKDPDTGEVITDYSPTAKRNLIQALENHILEQYPASRYLVTAKGERVARAVAENMIGLAKDSDGQSLTVNFSDTVKFLEKGEQGRAQEIRRQQMEKGLSKIKDLTGEAYTKAYVQLGKRLNVKSVVLTPEQKTLWSQNREKAIEGVTIDLSNLKSRQESGQWTKDNKPVLYAKGHEYEGTQKKAFHRIINKKAGELSTTDLDDLAKHILDKIKASGIDPTDVEIQSITKRSTEQYFGTFGQQALGTKLSQAMLLQQEKVRVATARMKQEAEIPLIAGEVKKEQTKLHETMIQVANRDGVTVAVQPVMMKWIKESEQEIKAPAVKKAIERLELVLKDTHYGAGNRADIILNFLQNHAEVDTWGTTNELILDWDEDGVINSRFWSTDSLDQEISDIGNTLENNTKLLRIILEKTGEGGKRYPMTEEEYNQTLHNSAIRQNDTLIKAATNEINLMKPYMKTHSRKTKYNMLKNQIVELEKTNKELNPDWTNTHKLKGK